MLHLHSLTVTTIEDGEITVRNKTGKSVIDFLIIFPGFPGCVYAQTGGTVRSFICQAQGVVHPLSRPTPPHWLTYCVPLWANTDFPCVFFFSLPPQTTHTHTHTALANTQLHPEVSCTSHKHTFLLFTSNKAERSTDKSTACQTFFCGRLKVLNQGCHVRPN